MSYISVVLVFSCIFLSFFKHICLYIILILFLSLCVSLSRSNTHIYLARNIWVCNDCFQNILSLFVIILQCIDPSNLYPSYWSHLILDTRGVPEIFTVYVLKWIEIAFYEVITICTKIHKRMVRFFKNYICFLL